MKTAEIKIGGRYTCVIRGKDAVVRVDGIAREKSKSKRTVKIFCTQEIINKPVIFRSPSRLIAELGERFPKFGNSTHDIVYKTMTQREQEIAEFHRIEEVYLASFKGSLSVNTYCLAQAFNEFLTRESQYLGIQRRKK